MFDPGNIDALQRVADALRRSDRLVLTCHVRPDGDALGSMLGLGLALEQMGKKVTCYCQDHAPSTLGFLPGIDSVVHDIDVPLAPGTTLVILDCSEARRVGQLGAELVASAGGLVVIDHHLGQDMCRELADVPCVQYINPDIFATGAICLALLQLMGRDITPDIATCLYTAILTDTGSFRHSNTTPLAFLMAASLVESGADPYEIADRIFERVQYSKLRLLALALDNLSIEAGGMAAVMHITGDMLESAGASLFDADDFVRYPRSLDGVEVSALIKEIEPGRVSVSMRSRSWFNVAELAKSFGGGGHFHAAGFRSKGDVSMWRSRLVEILARELNRSEAQDEKNG